MIWQLYIYLTRRVPWKKYKNFKVSNDIDNDMDNDLDDEEPSPKDSSRSTEMSPLTYSPKDEDNERNVGENNNNNYDDDDDDDNSVDLVSAFRKHKDEKKPT